MDCYSRYFEYSIRCVCGIPKITIEGTAEDWQRIRARVEVIGTYGLEWWVSRLRPILDEFVRTAEGHPAREFWEAIYKPVNAYGDEVATGWVADLFPYLGDAPNRRRSHVFKHERREWALPLDKGGEMAPGRFGPLGRKGVGRGSFPSGLSSAPVKVCFNDESTTGVDLVAGFFAVRRSLPDLALSPVIGWCVAEPAPEKPVMI